MARALIITEKPSVAREFARVLGVAGRKDGYLENDKYVITWCVGHLVEMVYPEAYDQKYKKWRLEDLPFLPVDYKYDVIENVRKQYDIVHGFLHSEEIDKVYWAGDSGKEGQTIEENIRNFGGVRPGMEEVRVWIDSQTEEEIKRGIDEAKPMSDYANLGKSGIMRAIEDYAMGINFSRVMSVKYGRLLNDTAGTENYTAIAVGRVMTCVLGMVVIREREIRNFVETPFYRVVGLFSQAQVEGEWRALEGSKYFESPLLYKENGFKKREDAQALLDAMKGKKAFVKDLEKGVSKKKAPLLFNLAELQAECAKRFKISPDETLQAAQDLYEKKLTTYPRTDARVLSSAVAKVITKNLNGLKAYGPTKSFTERILKEGMYKGLVNSPYTDDSKVTDHYAIIPTGQVGEVQNLTELQSKVYDLIVRRFLSIFYPPAVYQTVKMTIGVEEECFYAGGKALKEAGYLEIMGKQTQEDEEEGSKENSEKGSAALLSLAETLQKGDEIQVADLSMKEGKTSPPKRYTSGSMVLAMENAGQLIEDEELRAQIKGSGIGTSATRAEIIKKLIRIGYLNLNKKTQVLTPENLGEMVYEVVNMTVPQLLNPKMTASWEKGLDGITKGTVDVADYRSKLEDFIRTETVSMIGQNLIDPLADKIRPFAGKNGRGFAARQRLSVKCPMCMEGEVETTPFGYGCSNYKRDGSGCKFAIGTLAGKDLSMEDVKQLVETGSTPVLDGFVSKTKKKFSAAITLSKNEDGQLSMQFDFSQNQPKLVDDLNCPVCGAPMEITHFGYRCSKKNVEEEEGGCYFSVGKIAGRDIKLEELKTLITQGSTDVLSGFISKDKKKFRARLRLVDSQDSRKEIQFDFDDIPAEIVEGVTCPDCGGQIEVKSFGFGCSNFKGDEPDSCKFMIGTIAGKTLSAANVKELLTLGQTSTIRGFTSKTKKKFDACLVLTKNEEGRSVVSFDFENVQAKKIKDVVCPLCGGEIVQTKFGYGCSNYSKDDENSCRFSIAKIAGVKLKDSTIKELLTVGETSEVISGFKSKSGSKFDAKLKLVDGRIEFAFPEKPKPVTTALKCPKCQGEIQKSQWYYECGCGFRVRRIVAGVDLSEQQMEQLFTTGRTNDKVVGFTSKAGNTFDSCLRLEEDQIVFDFNLEPMTKEMPLEEQMLEDATDAIAAAANFDVETESGNLVSEEIGYESEPTSDDYWAILEASASENLDEEEEL